VSYLSGADEDTEPLPTTTKRTPGKVTVVNPFKIPYGATIDTDPKLKSCPLCGRRRNSFPHKPKYGVLRRMQLRGDIP
jgi:hypothetical protein